MELNEYERKALTEVWKDELHRDAVIKAFVVASAGTPELTVGHLHTLIAGVEAQVEEDKE